MLEWVLDPAVTYLNHGGFGGAPRAVLAEQDRWRAHLEANPTRFMVRELASLLDEARHVLAAFVGADPAGLVFVTNATSGVNAVVRSLPFATGDEIVVTDHGYAACRNVVGEVAARTGARPVVAAVPFPIDGPHEVTRAVLDAVTERTRLVLVDHVTSPTALVFPIADIAAALEPAGIPVLVDGAHAPGMIDLDVAALGVSFYTGNCHKWMCAPKGSAFLWSSVGHRDVLRPGTISHGWDGGYPGESRYHQLFDFTGTHDPSAYLTVPTAIRVVEESLAGGWHEMRTRNHELALAAREVLCAALAIEPPAPDGMIGTLAAVPVPPGDDDLGVHLAERHRIEAPVFAWPTPPQRLLRVSAQLHNTIEQYDRLAEIVATG